MSVAESQKIEPATVDEVVAAAQKCSEREMLITIGTDSASDSERRRTVISLSHLDSIAVDADSGVVVAGAGATVEKLQAAAKGVGMRIPGLQRAKSTTVGATIARGEVPRRSLCGIEMVLSTGEHVHSGGPVLKDVSGYDLVSAVLGSMGRLAIVVAATFRLVPDGAKEDDVALSGGAVESSYQALVSAFDPAGLLQS